MVNKKKYSLWEKNWLCEGCHATSEKDILTTSDAVWLLLMIGTPTLIFGIPIVISMLKLIEYCIGVIF